MLKNPAPGLQESPNAVGASHALAQHVVKRATIPNELQAPTTGSLFSGPRGPETQTHARNTQKHNRAQE